MSKWFSSAWFELESPVLASFAETGGESRVDLHGPFSSDKRREEAIEELVEENGDDYLIAVVRFDIEGESVPEIAQ